MVEDRLHQVFTVQDVDGPDRSGARGDRSRRHPGIGEANTVLDEARAMPVARGTTAAERESGAAREGLRGGERVDERTEELEAISSCRGRGLILNSSDNHLLERARKVWSSHGHMRRRLELRAPCSTLVRGDHGSTL
jgi:hypothetical protein